MPLSCGEVEAASVLSFACGARDTAKQLSQFLFHFCFGAQGRKRLFSISAVSFSLGLTPSGLSRLARSTQSSRRVQKSRKYTQKRCKNNPLATRKESDMICYVSLRAFTSFLSALNKHDCTLIVRWNIAISARKLSWRLKERKRCRRGRPQRANKQTAGHQLALGPTLEPPINGSLPSEIPPR